MIKLCFAKNSIPYTLAHFQKCKAMEAKYLNLRIIVFFYGKRIVAGLILCTTELIQLKEYDKDHNCLRWLTIQEVELKLKTILEILFLFCEQPKILQHIFFYM